LCWWMRAPLGAFRIVAWRVEVWGENLAPSRKPLALPQWHLTHETYETHEAR